MTAPQWLTRPLPASRSQQLVEQARMLDLEREHRDAAARQLHLAEMYARRAAQCAGGITP